MICSHSKSHDSPCRWRSALRTRTPSCQPRAMVGLTSLLSTKKCSPRCHWRPSLSLMRSAPWTDLGGRQSFGETRPVHRSRFYYRERWTHPSKTCLHLTNDGLLDQWLVQITPTGILRSAAWSSPCHAIGGRIFSAHLAVWSASRMSQTSLPQA